mgnify:CR=1 FL=1
MKTSSLNLLILLILLKYSTGQVCGDCAVDWPAEKCDDCNTDAGDGYIHDCIKSYNFV